MPLHVLHEFRFGGVPWGDGLIGGPYPADALSDHDLSTAVTVTNYIGPSGVLLNNARAQLMEPIDEPGAASRVTSTSQVWARFEADGPIADVTLETIGTGFVSRIDTTRAPRVTRQYTYYPMDANAWSRVDDCANTSVEAAIYVPADRDNPAHQTVIYEAWIVVTIDIPGAPPCRIFPRDDDLGVGAGRNYPPPKSQQRSSRGVGYY